MVGPHDNRNRSWLKEEVVTGRNTPSDVVLLIGKNMFPYFCQLSFHFHASGERGRASGVYILYPSS